MLTRRRLRRGVCWVGVAIGLLSLAAYVPCIFTTLAVGSSDKSIVLGRGAIALYWRPPGWTSGTNVLDPGKWQGGWWRWLPRWVEPDWMSVQTAPSATQAEIVLPLWIPAALGLVCFYLLLPERGPKTQCENCGYDLSAVPAKEGKVVCPECGTTRR